MKAVLTSLVLLSLSASPTSAGTINLYWTDCVGDGGTSNKSFSCTASSATDAAIGSFFLSSPLPDFVGVEVVLDLQAEDTTLPAWWDFAPHPGACHGASLSMTFDYSALANASCLDPFGQPGIGGLANYIPSGNRARIIGVGAIDANFPQALSANQEYYGFRLALRKDKATGAGSCAGCNVPVVIVLNTINAVGAAIGSNENNDTVATSQCVTYQNGCCQCLWVPTINRTWGQMKALYR